MFWLMLPQRDCIFAKVVLKQEFARCLFVINDRFTIPLMFLKLKQVSKSQIILVYEISEGGIQDAKD
jgi:hypothetical protein